MYKKKKKNNKKLQAIRSTKEKTKYIAISITLLP